MLHKKAVVQPALNVGDVVRVNCYDARIEHIQTHLLHTDPFTGHTTSLPLRQPLYVVRLDRRKKRAWTDNNHRVYIPDFTDTLKLYADEFVPVRRTAGLLPQRLAA